MTNAFHPKYLQITAERRYTGFRPVTAVRMRLLRFGQNDFIGLALNYRHGLRYGRQALLRIGLKEIAYERKCFFLVLAVFDDTEINGVRESGFSQTWC